MKKATYTIDEQGLMTVTIRVDCEASKACMMSCFTGFGLEDAIRNANKRLRLFGYEIA